jgi:hypothetical protein
MAVKPTIPRLDYAGVPAWSPVRPWVLVTAILLPALLQLDFLFVTLARPGAIPGNHSALLDLGALFGAVATGTVACRKSRRGRAVGTALLLLYVVVETAGLFIMSLALTNFIERS